MPQYKKLDDGSWYAEIPDFQGIWSNSESVEECRSELNEVLEEWLILKIRHGDNIPAAKGIINYDTWQVARAMPRRGQLLI